MNIKDKVYFVYKKLKDLPDYEVQEIELGTKINDEELKKIETRLNFHFPHILRNFYLNDASNISLTWNKVGSCFGEECKHGELNIISPIEIVQKVEEMKNEVNELLINKEYYEENEGMKAIVEDWIYWIPVIKFRNGDAFCFDTRQPDYPIVFLEHDVMDGGPNLHGLKIATNFEKLFRSWVNVGFVDIYDWYEVSTENGIDFNNKIFNKIRGMLENGF
ncbi:hypothetical protein UACE39S_02406 [Ureibacillus acetophenoni]